jgi:pilus assembly protein Flp/PilA
MQQQLMKFLRDEDGATAIEYGLIAGLVAVGIIAALTTLSGGLSGLFNGIATRLTGAAGGAAS